MGELALFTAEATPERLTAEVWQMAALLAAETIDLSFPKGEPVMASSMDSSHFYYK